MVEELAEEAQVTWYDITIAGKDFNIASRRGEAHIRDVERLVGETIEELKDGVARHHTLNLALLAALNIADQLVSLQTELNADSSPWSIQIRKILTKLDSVGSEEFFSARPSDKKDTSAVFD